MGFRLSILQFPAVAAGAGEKELNAKCKMESEKCKIKEKIYQNAY